MNVLFPILLAAAVSATQPVFEGSSSLQSASKVSTIQSTPDENPTDILNRNENTIYIGDSRFVQMELYLKKGDGYVIAKSSQGYQWLAETALPEVNRIKSEHPEVTTWTIVSNLGVNDLHNINKYVEEYQNIVDGGDRLVIMSVNPCDGKRCDLNGHISKFNTKLIESGFEYFDMAKYLNSFGFSTTDGVHYTKDTYIDIWNQMNAYLASNPKEDH